MDQTAALAREFEQETYRIEQHIWDAMALRSGESVLFCGFANNTDWIRRAAAVGVDVTVIANDKKPAELRDVPITILRGSTSMIPARDASFDATIAFHYLHEVDPFFHANIVSELSRVGKRCVIVEPAPPSDPLGLRIASLYSLAKRQLGQFENYHHIEYWRKLLAIVKSDVVYETFTFTRTPPREATRDTVAFILDTMAAEATPQSYLDELRALAQRPDAQLVPQEFRPGVIVSPFIPPSVKRTTPAIAATEKAPTVYSRPDAKPELPPVRPPRAPRTPPVPAAAPPEAGQIARNAFGLPVDKKPVRPPVAPSIKGENTDFGPSSAADDPAEEFGWEWETPTKP